MGYGLLFRMIKVNATVDGTANAIRGEYKTLGMKKSTFLDVIWRKGKREMNPMGLFYENKGI
jgi:hypothetical protein